MLKFNKHNGEVCREMMGFLWRDCEMFCHFLGKQVKAKRGLRMLKQAINILHHADEADLVECLESRKCAEEGVKCIRALKEHPEKYASFNPKTFKDYLRQDKASK